MLFLPSGRPVTRLAASSWSERQSITSFVTQLSNVRQSLSLGSPDQTSQTLVQPDNSKRHHMREQGGVELSLGLSLIRFHLEAS